MKTSIQSAIIFIFCACLATPAADVDAIRVSVRENRGKLRTEKHAEGLAQLKNATMELETHMMEHPKDFNAAYELGMTFFYLDNDERALESYALAARLNPEIYQPWFFTGLIHSYANNVEKGERAFLKASELAPKNADVWYELGVLYYNTDMTTKAIEAFEKTLEINPNNAQASYKLALNLMDDGQSEKAFPLLAAAAKARPNDANTLYNFGQLCQTLGKTQKSLAAFERVVKIDPTEWRAIEKLVQLNQALGDLKERDAARQMVFDLRTTGKVEALNEEPLYIRDQFKVEDQRVMTCEYFEMKGDRAIRYSFVVTDKTGKYRITLGSYDPTNDYAERQGKNKPGERTFHLDGYYADGAHRTFSFFRGEPDYDTVKELVVEILKGEMIAVSSTTATPPAEPAN